MRTRYSRSVLSVCTKTRPCSCARSRILSFFALLRKSVAGAWCLTASTRSSLLLSRSSRRSPPSCPASARVPSQTSPAVRALFRVIWVNTSCCAVPATRSLSFPSLARRVLLAVALPSVVCIRLPLHLNVLLRYWVFDRPPMVLCAKSSVRTPLFPTRISTPAHPVTLLLVVAGALIRLRLCLRLSSVIRCTCRSLPRSLLYLTCILLLLFKILMDALVMLLLVRKFVPHTVLSVRVISRLVVSLTLFLLCLIRLICSRLSRLTSL